jgi:hypothetical protein
LLGIAPDLQQGRLRGSAQAQDHRPMVDYVERLAAQPPFIQGRLLRHELDEKSGTRPLRFQFEVALRSPAQSEPPP